MYNGPQRKKLRLKGFDYSKNGFYFITICTKERENFFGNIVESKMILNEYGMIAKQNWENILLHYDNVEIDEFIIMPNHIHGIIIINNPVGNEYFRSETENDTESECFHFEKEYNNGNEDIYSLQNKANIGNTIKGFKIGCTKEIRNKYKDFNFGWQKSFFDKIIRNENQLEKTREYIINNPLKWEFDVNNPENINE